MIRTRSDWIICLVRVQYQTESNVLIIRVGMQTIRRLNLTRLIMITIRFNSVEWDDEINILKLNQVIRWETYCTLILYFTLIGSHTVSEEKTAIFFFHDDYVLEIIWNILDSKRIECYLNNYKLVTIQHRHERRSSSLLSITR